MSMNEQLDILLALDNADTYIRELSNEKCMAKLKEIGMNLDVRTISNFEKVKDKLFKKLPSELMREYQRLMKKYRDDFIPRAIVPVREERGEGYCVACSSRVPAEVFQRLKNHGSIERCENCARFIFWPPLP
ncbi:hypothetical protein JXA84_06840 [candidate division WOR-3 bacterium]|nr:hypothetical protein [candidate division WOR-3 bacterium]